MPTCACGATIQSGSKCQDCRLAEEYEADDLVTDGGELTADDTLRLTDDGLEMPEWLRGYSGQFTLEDQAVEGTLTAEGLPDTEFYDGVIAVMPSDGDYNPRIPEDHFVITAPGEPEWCYEIVDEHTEEEIVTDGGTPVTQCYDCECELSIRSALYNEVPIHHDEGLGYDMVEVPLCRGCALQRWGKTCEECGKQFLSLGRLVEHQLQDHVSPDRGQPITDGGRDEEQFYVVDEDRSAVVDGPYDDQDEASDEADERGAGHIVATERALDLVEVTSTATIRWENDDVDVVTDGGRDLPTPSEWPFAAVVHGTDVALNGDCLALTGSEKPCSYNARAGKHLCGTHLDANDPDVVVGAHQWARITDGDLTIAVCLSCQGVWRGGTPAIAVGCPECDAVTGERCRNTPDRPGSVAGTISPHPQRRRHAMGVVDGYERCPAGPGRDVDDDQAVLVTDGGVPQGAVTCTNCGHTTRILGPLEIDTCPSCGEPIDPDAPVRISTDAVDGQWDRLLGEDYDPIGGVDFGRDEISEPDRDVDAITETLAEVETGDKISATIGAAEAHSDAVFLVINHEQDVGDFDHRISFIEQARGDGWTRLYITTIGDAELDPWEVVSSPYDLDTGTADMRDFAANGWIVDVEVTDADLTPVDRNPDRDVDGRRPATDGGLTDDHGVPPITDASRAMQTIAGPDPAAFEDAVERGDLDRNPGGEH